MAMRVQVWDGQIIAITSQNSGWIDIGVEGTWTVKASNDPDGAEAGVAIPFSANGGAAVTSVALAAAATDEHIFNVTNTGMGFVRLEFARTAGSVGTADLLVSLQGLAA